MAAVPASQAYRPDANVPGGYTTLPLALIGKIQGYLSVKDLTSQGPVCRQSAKALPYSLAHHPDSALLDLFLKKVCENNGFDRVVPSPTTDEFTVATDRVFSAICDETFCDEGIASLVPVLKTLRVLRLHFPPHSGEIQEKLIDLNWKEEAKELKWIFFSGTLESKTLQALASCFHCTVNMLNTSEHSDSSPSRDPLSPPLAALLSNPGPQEASERPSPTKQQKSPPRPVPQEPSLPPAPKKQKTEITRPQQKSSAVKTLFVNQS